MPSFYGARISKEVPEGNLMCICHAIMMSKIFSISAVQRMLCNNTYVTKK